MLLTVTPDRPFPPGYLLCSTLVVKLWRGTPCLMTLAAVSGRGSRRQCDVPGRLIRGDLRACPLPACSQFEVLKCCSAICGR